MRLKPEASNFEPLDDDRLLLEFDLPKGTYATVVLRELVDLLEER